MKFLTILGFLIISPLAVAGSTGGVGGVGKSFILSMADNVISENAVGLGNFNRAAVIAIPAEDFENLQSADISEEIPVTISTEEADVNFHVESVKETSLKLRDDQGQTVILIPQGSTSGIGGAKE